MRRITLAVLSSMAAIVALGAASVSARAATVIYNNFGSGQVYNNDLGYQIKACFKCATEYAASFTPSSNYTLSQIDIALFWIGHANNEAKVELVDSSGGHPGTTVLESWNLSGMAYFGSGSPPDSLLSTGGVTLSSGTQYWVVANPASSGWDLWNDNNQGHFGGLAEGFEGINGGYSWFSGSGYTPAFDVLGTSPPPPPSTPEPSSLVLLGSGILGLAGVIKRKLFA